VFRWIQHAGELELELESESEDGVFIDALEALRELLEEDTGAGLEGAAEYEVTAVGTERGELLADWLRKLSALAEDDGFVPARIAAIEIEGDGLTATVEGSCGASAHLVGGVSEDGLVYEPAPDSHRVHARVVLTTQADVAGAG
jgi:SHS2 domain-containing protein